MKKNVVLALLLFAGCFSIHAKDTRQANLLHLLKLATKFSGVNYSVPEGFKGKLKTMGKVNLTKENIDKILSLALYQNGYTRIKVNEDFYSIINTRDIRYEATQMYKAFFAGEIKVPVTYDYFMLEYSFKNKGLTTDVLRSLRPFMSRFGRIIDVKRSNKIILQDTGIQIHRLIKIIRGMDLPRTEDEKEQAKEYQKFQRELKLKRAESGYSNCKGK